LRFDVVRWGSLDSPFGSNPRGRRFKSDPRNQNTRATRTGNLITDMLTMSVDTRAIERRLNSLAAKQVPFAAAQAINDVAGLIRDAEPRGLERDLDRPAPFTKRGLFISRASKRKLTAVVGFKRIQSEYLSTQADGGKRRAKRRAVVVPVGIRLNKYGNMPRGSLKRHLGKPDVFSGTVKGVAGIWQRPKRGVRRAGSVGTKGSRKGLKLLAIYKDSVRYKPRHKFQPRALVLARKSIAPAFDTRLRAAVKTAR
jgi:hypothetical protein